MRGAAGTTSLEVAADAVRETCELQLGLVLQASSPDGRMVQKKTDWYRSDIYLAARDGRWRLTLVVDSPSAGRLAQKLFALDPDEEPRLEELADALNELVNIAAGVFKRDQRVTPLRLTLPRFAEGWPDLPPAAGGKAAVHLSAGTADLQICVLLCWLQPEESGEDRDEP